MARIDIVGLNKSYDGKVPALADFDLSIGDGEFCVFVGPSGCGKSTALKILAGLEPASSGTVSIDGRDVTDLGPGKRDIAMVFQNYALYPHMTVASNIGFGLKMRGVPRAEIRERVTAAAKMLEIGEYLDRKPRSLSGGQRQRVALGRAIVREPKAFLMDEPLSNLDAKLRVQTRSEIVKLQRRLGVTTVYVTHDQTEALTMSDRIVVLRNGRVQQVGTPEDLFERPANVFVAGFIGSPQMNFLAGPVEGGEGALHTTLFGCRIALGPEAAPLAGRQAVLGIRPEHIRIGGEENTIEVEIALVESLGSEKILHVPIPPPERLGDAADAADAAGGDAGMMLARVIDDRRFREGERTRLALPRGKIHVFDPATHAKLM